MYGTELFAVKLIYMVGTEQGTEIVRLRYVVRYGERNGHRLAEVLGNG